MRWCAGLSGSCVSVGSASVVSAGSGIRAKRCFSLVSTTDSSSGNVTWMEARRCHESWNWGLESEERAESR